MLMPREYAPRAQRSEARSAARARHDESADAARRATE